MGEAVENLIAYWRSLNATITRGNSDEDVRAFESRNGVAFPSDFRAYLLRVNGVIQDCDPNGFIFWRLAEIRSVRQEYARHWTAQPDVEDPDRRFVFADCSKCS